MRSGRATTGASGAAGTTGAAPFDDAPEAARFGPAAFGPAAFAVVGFAAVGFEAGLERDLVVATTRRV